MIEPLRALKMSALVGAALITTAEPVRAQDQAKERPNILVIMPDDVGLWNISAYNRGSRGYRTPSIDRLAEEGALFSDMYAQPSCTPGRASFITGMYPIRSGLTTVGMVGAKQGMRAEVPTLAEVLKQQGYATGQFGKNHLGDRNEHLPTVHGFDEFYGFLYHLNVLQEPLDNDYPKSDAFRAKFEPRGIIHSFATDTYDASVPDDRFGEVGKQRVEDTGLPDEQRFETLDAELNGRAFDFMERAVAADEPFFVWLNPSRMHVFTFTPDAYKERAREHTSYDDPHGAGMIQHDDDIGAVLAKLDKLGVGDDTIVVYTTDNGPEHSTHPHGGITRIRRPTEPSAATGGKRGARQRWRGTEGHHRPDREAAAACQLKSRERRKPCAS
jgi:arylsulfatase